MPESCQKTKISSKIVAKIEEFSQKYIKIVVSLGFLPKTFSEFSL